MKQFKIALLLICLAFSSVASAMKIQTDEIDEFTGKRTLITSWEGICKQDIHIRFRLQNGHQFLDFKMFANGGIVIGEKDKLMFKSFSENIGSFSSVSIYHGERGGGAVGMNGSEAWGISACYFGDLSYFSDNVTRLIRVYTTDGYFDEKVSEIDGKKIQKLYGLFSSSMGKPAGKDTSYINCTIKFLTSSNKGRTWDIVKEEYVEDASPEELTEMVNNWKAQSTDKKMFDCKIQKEK